ncbi:hypothetical protein [Pseudomonas putida]|uniref:hypothetical protein n=1 Tax=Pseudomonas putida TaxID=303 RepID=UPI001CB8FD1B|nr:hypothetical protein [Pseudomonas putida]MCG3646587.1 hypothetical protein [Pseudomonas putida]
MSSNVGISLLPSSFLPIQNGLIQMGLMVRPVIPGIALIDYVRVGFSNCWLNGNGRQIPDP